jgi:hypothetical protein
MLDTVVEEVHGQVERNEVIGSLEDSSDIEEIANSESCNENPTQDNTSVDIVSLLKDVYAGVGKKKLEERYNIDLSLLLGNSAGIQSSWDGRVSNANALIQNYTTVISTPEGVLNEGLGTKGTLEDILSLQESVVQDFEKKKARIERYHRNKKLKNGLNGDELIAKKYIANIITNLSTINTTTYIAQDTFNSLIGLRTPYDPTIEPKIDPLSNDHLLQAQTEPESSKDKYLFDIPDSLIEPLDSKASFKYGEDNTRAALDIAQAETPLLLFDYDALHLGLNLEEGQKKTRVGYGVLAAGLGLAASIVLSVPILELGKACENYLQGRVPISITMGITEQSKTSGNLSMASVVEDPIGEILAEIETLDENQPSLPIEYITQVELEVQLEDYKQQVEENRDVMLTFYDLVSADSPMTAEQFFRHNVTYRISQDAMNASERRYEGTFAVEKRVRESQEMSNILTLANVPSIDGVGGRIMVVAPEGIDQDEYGIARLPGFNNLSADVQYTLMGAFDTNDIVANSSEFFTQDSAGSLVSTRACNGRWETTTVSQRDLGYHERGRVILPCNQIM